MIFSRNFGPPSQQIPLWRTNRQILVGMSHSKSFASFTRSHWRIQRTQAIKCTTAAHNTVQIHLTLQKHQSDERVPRKPKTFSWHGKDNLPYTLKRSRTDLRNTNWQADLLDRRSTAQAPGPNSTGPLPTTHLRPWQAPKPLLQST